MSQLILFNMMMQYSIFFDYHFALTFYFITLQYFSSHDEVLFNISILHLITIFSVLIWWIANRF